MRDGLLVQAPTQGIVAVIDFELVVVVADQTVEQVPSEMGVCAVMQAMNQVATFVVLVMSTGILAQQVVHYDAGHFPAGF